MKKAYVEAYEKIMASSVFRLNGEDIDLIDALQKLGDALQAESEEIDWATGEFTEASLDNLVIGAYWSLTEWHAGQESASYAAMCSLGVVFKPGMTNPPKEEESEFTAYELCGKWFEKNAAIKKGN